MRPAVFAALAAMCTPVASAEVRIHKSGQPILIADLDTDSAGRFEGPDVPSGDYVIEVLKPNSVPASLHVSSGGAVQILLTRYGATITLLAVAPNGPMRPLNNNTHTATDARGQFRISNLAPGRYAVAASCEGGAETQSHPIFRFVLLEFHEVRLAGCALLCVETCWPTSVALKRYGLPEAGERPCHFHSKSRWRRTGDLQTRLITRCSRDSLSSPNRRLQPASG